MHIIFNIQGNICYEDFLPNTPTERDTVDVF